MLSSIVRRNILKTNLRSLTMQHYRETVRSRSYTQHRSKYHPDVYIFIGMLVGGVVGTGTVIHKVQSRDTIINFEVIKLTNDETQKCENNEEVMHYLLEKSTPKSKTCIGLMYQYGTGVPQNYTKAIEYYKIAANQGESEAQYRLGCMYDNGFGVRKSYRKAFEYYELAANQHNASAQNNLGFLFASGHGVHRNSKKAIEYFELAAKQHNTSALLNLGDTYMTGWGVPIDYEKSRKYFELAAKQKDSHAQRILGDMYLQGKGVKQNLLKALEYYIRSILWSIA